jgi:hypothetical protein
MSNLFWFTDAVMIDVRGLSPLVQVSPQVSQGAPHGNQPAVEKGGPGGQTGRLIGRTKGGINTKLHAVTDADGRPIRFFMTAGQVSDTPARRCCWATCQKQSDCWPAAVMTLTGSEKR